MAHGHVIFNKVHMTSVKINSSYRSDIDGLRAIAVLLVVAFHVYPTQIKGGFIGVDIFFVISGYLISYIILNSLSNGTFSFTSFYMRRVRRIFPSLIVVLSFTLLYATTALFPDEFKQLGKHLTGGTSFLSNLLLYRESGYFDASSDTKPLLHLWSLGIEEQFYIIWPFLLWILWKRQFNTLTVCVSLLICSFVLNISLVKFHPIATFYLPFTRFWELLVGAILAHSNQKIPNLNKILRHRNKSNVSSQSNNRAKFQLSLSSNAQSLIGFLLIIAGLLLITNEKYFPGGWALLPTLGAAFLLTAGPEGLINRKILSSRILVWFGLISFPLYLWHWPLLFFAHTFEGELLSKETQIIIIILSISLAYFTYKLIELPLRFGQFEKIKTLLLISSAMIIGLIGFSIYKYDFLIKKLKFSDNTAFMYETSKLGYLPCQYPEFLQEPSLGYCLTNSKEKINAAIIGDSHADDKFHGIVKNDKNHNWILLGNSSCPPIYGINFKSPDAPHCTMKVEKILNWLERNSNIKTVALSFYGQYSATTNYAADHVSRKLGPAEIKITSTYKHLSKKNAFEEGLNNSIQRLLSAHKTVILFADVPELPFFPRNCIRRKDPEECKLKRQEVDTRQAELSGIISRLKKRNPELLVFDPITLICDNDSCSYKNTQTILYRDSHHLSLQGSDVYGKYFSNWAKNHLG